MVQGALVFEDEALYRRYREIAVLTGATPGPFDCYLVERAIRTLTARMPLHFRNSLIVAKFLEQHPAVERVIHIGLKSHQDHELAKQLLNGTSGVLTFYLKNGSIDKVIRFFKALKLIISAGSLGGVESTISCP